METITKKFKAVVLQLLLWSLSGLFLYSGSQKLHALTSFATNIESYQLLPGPLCEYLTLYLPYLEIVLGLALLLFQWRKSALLLIIVLLLIFIAALGLAWARGLDIRCGCFGDFDVGSNYLTWVARDFVLLVLGSVLLNRTTSQEKVPFQIPR